MPPLIRKERITCEDSGAQTTRSNFVQHKNCCSAVILFCTHCPNLSKKSQSDLNRHYAKKHSAPKPDATFKWKLCYQEFLRFYDLRQHRNLQRGMQIGSRTRDVDVEHIVRDVEDHRFKEELRSCQHFLVDFKRQRARHKVFNSEVEISNEKFLNEKLFFNNLKCAAKVNLAFGFILEKTEDGAFR